MGRSQGPNGFAGVYRASSTQACVPTATGQLAVLGCARSKLPAGAMVHIGTTSAFRR